MSIFDNLKKDIETCLHELSKDILGETIILENFNLELPKDIKHGDIATNAAMVNCKAFSKKPFELAKLIISKLELLPYISKAEIAGPGFINFFIKNNLWHEQLRDILLLKENYGKSTIGNNIDVNLEYVSANPTGPMHVGHSRSAVYGDILVSLLKFVGFNVTKEYYVNDAGNQIDSLVKSVYARYLELQGQDFGTLLEYPGEYLIDLAKSLLSEYGNKLIGLDNSELSKIIKPVAVNAMLQLIKKDLQLIGIEHDIFFSEQTLHDKGDINHMVDFLRTKGLVYNGVVEPPKGKKKEDWQQREQLLFASSQFGDDTDRSLTKNDGSWTYFAADMAYMYNKIQRKYQKIIVILGADHIGYFKRIEAIFKALTNNDPNYELQVKFCQLVNLMRDGKPFKMSKRKGELVFLSEVLEHLSKDVIRFMMLTRKNDMVLDFDLEKAKEQSKDNPVFYVQYASARCHSILNKAKEEYPEIFNLLIDKNLDLSLLNTEEELGIIKLMSYWPKFIETAALAYEPHRIVFYLSDICAKFHALWNKGNEDKSLRFINPEQPSLTAARLLLIQGLAQVIANALTIMNVEITTHM